MRRSYSKKYYYCFFIATFIMAASLFFPQQGKSATITAKTSMTVINVTNWKAPYPKDSPLSSFPVKSKLWGVTITPTKISWRWTPGLSGLFWVFWTEDKGKTFSGWGWDYVTPYHTYKLLTAGYASGWVGTAVGTCQDCEGYPARTTVFFTDSYH